MSAHERHSTPARVGAYWAWNLMSANGSVVRQTRYEVAVGG